MTLVALALMAIIGKKISTTQKELASLVILIAVHAKDQVPKIALNSKKECFG
jgi:hypothetical protein